MSRFSRVRAEEAMTAARKAAQLLADDARVELVYLFGSVADTQRALVGDVDLAIWAEPAIPLDDLLRLRADLVLRTGVEIDLISLNDAPVVLAHEIADSGRCLFARHADAEVTFVTRARSRYWDFKPYLDEQWHLAGARIEERRRGPAA